ncbi:unnamed protein product [Cunninghamella blakesleeana]
MISTVMKQPLSLIINKNDHDSHPMLALFSPTALKRDLTYVDKTYYNTNNRLSSSSFEVSSNHRKSTDTSHLSINTIMLTKAIGILSSAKKLDLRSLNLLLLPSPIIDLSHLTLLDLSYNQLTHLPPTFKQLKHLKHLNLAHNQLNHLPHVICELPKLKTLDVSYNTELTTIPRSLSKAKHLIYLDISYTNISALPAELYHLFTIRYEHCSRLMTNIEEGFTSLLTHSPPSLMELCARKIMSLPNYAFTLKLMQQQREKGKKTTTILKKYHHYLHHEEGKNEIIIDEIENKEEENIKKKSTSYYHHHHHSLLLLLNQKFKHLLKCKNKIKSIIYHQDQHHSSSSSSSSLPSKKQKMKTMTYLPTTSALLRLPHHLWDYMMKAQPCSFCDNLFVDDFIIRYRIMKRSDETFLPIYYQLCSAHWIDESDRLLLQFSTCSKKSILG